MATQNSGNYYIVGRNPLFMLDRFPIILLISTCLGFLAGLGVGGGSLLLVWLTAVVGMDYSAARIINLFFFLPAAIISSYFRKKEGSLDYKKVLPCIIAGCISAGIATFLSFRTNTDLLRKGFGLLLMLTGIRELLYKAKNQ